MPSNELPNKAAEQGLLELQARFKAKLEAKIYQLAKAWRHIERADRWSDSVETAANELLMMAHSLSGSAGTFGFDATSEIAGPLECIIRYIHDEKVLPSSERRVQVELLVGRLVLSLDQTSSTYFANAQLKFGKKGRSSDIFIIDAGADGSAHVAKGLENHGYNISEFSKIEDAIERMKDIDPAAVIIDTVGQQNRQALKLVHDHHPEIPFLLLLDEDDFDTRLQVAQAGGRGFLVRPVDVDSLIEWLDRITGAVESDPFEVLVIDDDPALAECFAMMLGAAGMRADVLGEPRHILDALAASRPDVILMDIFMADCSGIDLAKVVRQQEHYLGIPIMFVSNDTDVTRRYQAMIYGGDDVLEKPISPEQMVLAVSTRAARARALRAVMEKDSLTGLLNHAMLKDRLEQEVARARRTASSLSFALIDIDRFKSVNDNYGHQTGDMVLRALSKLLGARLRRSDIIGRYGGEEFAVILPETAMSQARVVIDKLRVHFQNIEHQTGTEKIQITFSAGLSEYSEGKTADEMIGEADERLYRAKDKGRNRVE